MTYEAKTLRRQKIRYNSANEDAPIIYQFAPSGAKLTPDADTALITVYSPDGTKVVDGESMTISGTLVSYEIDTTTVASFPESHGYRADITIDSSSVQYDAHVIFDVVSKLLNIGVTRDTLVARDSSIQGSEHAGYESLAPFIEACRDELQLKLEAKVNKDGRVWEEMILDHSRLSIPARLYILWQHHADQDAEGAKAEHFKNQYRELWSDFKNAVRYKDGDDFEKSSLSTPIVQRLKV